MSAATSSVALQYGYLYASFGDEMGRSRPQGQESRLRLEDVTDLLAGLSSLLVVAAVADDFVDGHPIVGRSRPAYTQDAERQESPALSRARGLVQTLPVQRISYNSPLEIALIVGAGPMGGASLALAFKAVELFRRVQEARVAMYEARERAATSRVVAARSQVEHAAYVVLRQEFALPGHASDDHLEGVPARFMSLEISEGGRQEVNAAIRVLRELQSLEIRSPED